MRYIFIGIATLTIVQLVVERVFIADDSEPPPITVITTEPDTSVAVLPFADFTQTRDQEWFADGLAKEILNALARTPDLKVSSRTSVFAYKSTDKDVSTIGRKLNVAHVLKGSIRGTGERLRVTAQRFLAVHAAVYNLFNLGRHLVSAKNYRFFRSRAFSSWNRATE